MFTHFIILFAFLLIVLAIRYHMEAAHGLKRAFLINMLENLTFWAKSNNDFHDSRIDDEKRKQIQESSERRLGLLLGGAVAGVLINIVLLVFEFLPVSASLPMIITIACPLMFSFSSIGILSIISSLAADAPIHKHSASIMQEEIDESELQFSAIKPTMECVGWSLCLIHAVAVLAQLYFKIDYPISSLIDPTLVLYMASVIFAVYAALDFLYSKQREKTVKNIVMLRIMLALSIYLCFLFFQCFIK